MSSYQTPFHEQGLRDGRQQDGVLVYDLLGFAKWLNTGNPKVHVSDVSKKYLS